MPEHQQDIGKVQLTPRLSEPLPFPAVVQDELHSVKMRKDEEGTLFVQVEQAEVVVFSAAVVTNKGKVRLIFDTPTQPITLEPAPTLQQIEVPASVTPVTLFSTQDIQTASQESKEKDAPVMLYGRFAKKIETKPSPNGGTKATVRFAEHPSHDQDSYYHSLSEAEKKALKRIKLYYIEKTDTFWWPVTAFDEKVALLAGVRSGLYYRIFCYPQWLTETEDGKKKKSFIHNLVGVQRVKQRKAK